MAGLYSPPLQEPVLEALLIGEEGWVGMVEALPFKGREKSSPVDGVQAEGRS
jgi:hypothetical protein